MKALKFLTAHQPWPALISSGVKKIETRPTSTKYRGLVAIHAGLSRDTFWALWHGAHQGPPKSAAWMVLDALGYETTWGEPEDGTGCIEACWWDTSCSSTILPLGAVVAVAELTDVLPIVDDPDDLPDSPACLEVDHPGWLVFWPEGVVDREDTIDCSDQLPFGDFSPGRFGWLLDNVRQLARPVPMRGALGLRDMEPALAAEVLAQLGEVNRVI